MEDELNSGAALPQDKAELLARIQQEWSALMQLVQKLTPQQLVKPGSGGWSAKDNLAHLTAWEQFMLRHYLGNEPPHEVLQVEAATFARLDEDGQNDLLYQRHKARPLEAVLDELEESHQQVLSTLEQLTFADLLKPRFEAEETGPVLARVVGNTYEHYREHRQAIAAMIGD